MTVECRSRITAVTVHARGALVTRAVEAGPLPDGDVELLVPGITPLAEPGSFRARLQPGGRAVVSVQAKLFVPASGALAGAPVEALRELDARIARLEAERARKAALRGKLRGLRPAPGPRSLRPPAELGARVREALLSAGLAAEAQERLDRRLAELEAQLEGLRREREARAREAANASARERMGQGHPTRTARLQLAGSGAAEGLAITYAVPAARWWPASELRLVDGGRAGSWELVAQVAQLTGEEWSAVQLTLSTADLLFDARLPELASLRFSRAQPRKRTGWRPPPEGVERLFSGYDRGFAPPPRPPQPAPLPPPPPPPAPPMAEELAEAVPGGLPDQDVFADLAASAPAPVAAPAPAPRMRKMAMQPITMRAPAPAAAPMAQARGGGAAFLRAEATPAPPEPEGPPEPDGGWLDYDGLALGGPDAGRARGRLRRGPGDPQAGARAEAAARLEQLRPERLIDPLQGRGQFDHAWIASVPCDVPGDGGPHRVLLASAAAAPALRLRCVPREEPAVFREAVLKNPFDGPLLAGPVDVRLDGALLGTTAAGRVDRGGELAVGLGVEERIGVARNARASEGSAGLLGGSTAVAHEISIELSSALGREALVEVVERMPVSEEKTVVVERLSAAPEPQRYTQDDRGRPVRGGLLWKVVLPAGGKAQVQHAFRITLPAKDELVGGNRRE